MESPKSKISDFNSRFDFAQLDVTEDEVEEKNTGKTKLHRTQWDFNCKLKKTFQKHMNQKH